MRFKIKYIAPETPALFYRKNVPFSQIIFFQVSFEDFRMPSRVYRNLQRMLSLLHKVVQMAQAGVLCGRLRLRQGAAGGRFPDPGRAGKRRLSQLCLQLRQ